MRTKPDVSEFTQTPKDPSAFLDGAQSGFGEQPAVPTPQTMTIEISKPEPTVQKLFRLRWDVASALKVGAAKESTTAGRRVTETEIVERLLRKHYGLDI